MSKKKKMSPYYEGLLHNTERFHQLMKATDVQFDAEIKFLRESKATGSLNMIIEPTVDEFVSLLISSRKDMKKTA